MKIKKGTLKNIIREELNKTLKELVPVRVPGMTPEEGPEEKALMGFSNIVSVEPLEALQANDPDLKDITAFSKSHKPYKVTLPGGIKYIFAKHFTDRDNNMPEKAFFQALGNAPEIPQQFEAALSKVVLKFLSEKSFSSLDVGGEYDPDFGKEPDKKPPHAGGYIDRPSGRVYAKGVKEMKITKSKLIQIIKEEIAKTVKENYRDTADDSMADTVPHS